MELALGTVQFGLPYGIAGRDAPVPPGEAKAILDCAAECGVHLLDTASTYGDVESRLSSLIGDARFDIVTKLRPRPPALRGEPLADWVAAELRHSLHRLGKSLRAVMFHRAEDLLDDDADRMWSACAEVAGASDLRIGVSCYDVNTLQRVRVRFPVALAQLPGNALDQRVAQAGPLAGIDIHLRSAFLQGLLLMREPEVAARLPRAASALARWHSWCRAHGLAPLAAALGLVKGFQGVTHCVVGADNLSQFQDIVQAWRDAPVLHAPELALSDGAVIDPRQWNLGAA